jgi:hypothetical protein
LPWPLFIKCFISRGPSCRIRDARISMRLPV